MRNVKNEILLQSRDGVVSVLTGLGAERSGVRIPEGYGILLSFRSSRHALGPTQLVPGRGERGRGEGEGGRRPGCDDNHSPSSRAEVKNE